MDTIIPVNKDPLYLQYFIKKINLGPKLPRRLGYPTMICSPSGKGVVIIGGQQFSFTKKEYEYSDALIELSGYSLDSLKWTVLQQKLRFPRHMHLSFSIPNDTYLGL